MKQATEKKDSLSSSLLIIYIVFFISLICSFRAVSSISTGLLVIAGILYSRRQNNSLFASGIKSLFFIACLCYLLLQLLLYPLTDNTARGWQELVLKTGLVFTPLMVFATGSYIRSAKQKLATAYLFILAVAALYCLTRAITCYYKTGDAGCFFYHSLVHPLKQHAVYFSLLVYFGILCLLEGLMARTWYFSRAIHLLLLIFFIIFLALLSSKLVITWLALTLLYYLIIRFRNEKNNKAVLLVTALVFLGGLLTLFITRNPVSNRFNEILSGDITVVEQDSYRPDEYFNGLQFRLLQWKLVPEILAGKNAWLHGVGAGHSQNLLTQKYISKNMYTGSPGDAGKGYAQYNTHNQWLESLLKNGIAGLLCLFLIAAGLLQLVIKKKKRIISFTVILLLLYSFTEAILETQYGVMLFCFFPLFFSFVDE
jgi:O-antigen ligase